MNLNELGKEIEEDLQGNRENPIDDGGPGFNDEKNGIPGEQEGHELETHAENQTRNERGEFVETIFGK